jgi:hypothetical protein
MALLKLFIISALAQFPLSLIRFFLPIYASDFGANNFELGLMGASYGITYIALAAYFGRFVEKVGHRFMIFLGLLFYALIVLCYIFVHRPYLFVIGRAGEAVSMALVWPSIEVSSKISKNAKISVLAYTVSWSIAASFAPYVGSFLAKPYFYEFLVASLVSIIGGFVSLFLPKIQAVNIIVEKKNFSTMSDIVIPIFLYGFNSSVISSFYPVFGKILFGINGSGLIMTIAGSFMVIAFIFSAFVKINYFKLLIAGLTLQIMFLNIFLFRSFFVQLVSISLIYFGLGLVYYIILFNIINTFSLNVGIKTGIFESSIGAGFTIGPLISGLPSIFGLKLPWIISFFESIIVILVYISMKILKH